MSTSFGLLHSFRGHLGPRSGCVSSCVSLAWPILWLQPFKAWLCCAVQGAVQTSMPWLFLVFVDKYDRMGLDEEPHPFFSNIEHPQRKYEHLWVGKDWGIDTCFPVRCSQRMSDTSAVAARCLFQDLQWYAVLRRSWRLDHHGWGYYPGTNARRFR